MGEGLGVRAEILRLRLRMTRDGATGKLGYAKLLFRWQFDSLPFGGLLKTQLSLHPPEKVVLTRVQMVNFEESEHAGRTSIVSPRGFESQTRMVGAPGLEPGTSTTPW